MNTVCFTDLLLCIHFAVGCLGCTFSCCSQSILLSRYFQASAHRKGRPCDSLCIGLSAFVCQSLRAPLRWEPRNS